MSGQQVSSLSVDKRRSRGGTFRAIVVRDALVHRDRHHQVTPTFDLTAHAEIVASRKAC
jgi:tRNA(Arg) A34 adenosine deaminase TadA